MFLFTSTISDQALARDQVPPALAEMLESVDQAGVLLVDPSGNVIVSFNAESALVAASTVKLLTALMSLETWGAGYRFATRFTVTASIDEPSTNTLWIEGSGDPFLVSEELAFVARELHQRMAELDKISIGSVFVDDSLYAKNLSVPGRSDTTNPYDAVPAPWAANFNSINLAIENGRLRSAEKQTPLTKQAIERAIEIGWIDSDTLQPGVANRTAERFSLAGHTSGRASLYATELLINFLHQQSNESASIFTSPLQYKRGEISAAENSGISVTYTHRNRLTLAEMLQNMLKYSTNFISNQLALNLAVVSQQGDAVADFESFSELAQRYLAGKSSATDEAVLEGAGLSRQTRLSASTLTKLVNGLLPWHQVLPRYDVVGFSNAHDFDVHAKTGSLKGVSSLAGTIRMANPENTSDSIKPHELWRFAIILNDPSLHHRQQRDAVLSFLLRLVSAQ